MILNINIANILRNTHSGRKLYSPMYGYLYFQRVDDDIIICSTKENCGTEISFYSNGTTGNPIFNVTDECMLFPSKTERDWNNFCPFEVGDIVEGEGYTFIFDGVYNNYVSTFVVLLPNGTIDICPIEICKVNECTLASNQKKILFEQKLKESGYTYNKEKKKIN